MTVGLSGVVAVACQDILSRGQPFLQALGQNLHYPLLALAMVLGAVLLQFLLNRAHARHNYDTSQTRSNTRDIASASFGVAQQLLSPDVQSQGAWLWAPKLLGSLTTLDQAFSNCNLFQAQVGSRPALPVLDLWIGLAMVAAPLSLLVTLTIWMRPGSLLQDLRALSALIRSPVRSKHVAQAAMLRVQLLLEAATARRAELTALAGQCGPTAALLGMLLLLVYLLSTSSSHNVQQYEKVLKSLYGLERSCCGS